MSTTETPGKVWICPECGARYAEPTVCTNEHPPAVCDEYDLAAGQGSDVEPADGTTTAGDGEPTPEAAQTAPEPAADDPAEPAPAEAAPPVQVDTSVLDAAQQQLRDAGAALDAAVADLKTKLGL